jgi:putative membrane protein insertion efficiency factor
MTRQIISAVVLAPIHFYRYLISPLLGPACRFEPSCSSYAIEAIRTHGPLKGTLMGAKRILRCRPGGGSGYDPVLPLALHPLSDVETLRTQPLDGSTDGSTR